MCNLHDMSSEHKLFTGVNSTGHMLRRLAHSSLKSFLPVVKNSDKNKKGAMILHPAPSFGSLGDQAMLLAAIRGLRENHYNEVALLTSGRPSRADMPVFADNLLNPQLYFDGSIIDSIRFLKYFAAKDGLFVVGADVMDGYYSPIESLQKIHLLSLAASLGLPSKVFGFSFNEQPADVVVTALRALPANVTLLARDPVSCRRLESRLDRSVRLVADLAFLIHPDPTGESAKSTLSWIKHQRAQGAKVIGINANSLLARGNFEDPFPIATGLAHTIIDLHRTHPELCIVMIPHDFRGAFNDVVLNRITTEMASFGNAALSKRIFSMPNTCSAEEVKAVCGELDFAITGRMHLAIACLGQGTPAICIGYQGKMEGLLEHFELQNMIISPSNAFNSNGLADLAKTTLARTSELRAQINKHLPRILSLAKLNFE